VQAREHFVVGDAFLLSLGVNGGGAIYGVSFGLLMQLGLQTLLRQLFCNSK